MRRKTDNYSEITNHIVKNSIYSLLLTLPQLFTIITKDERAAVLLSQSIYWSDKNPRLKNTFYKSYDEWSKETGIGKKAVRRAMNVLIKMGFISTDLKKANGAPTLHYTVNFDKVWEYIHMYDKDVYKQKQAKRQPKPTRNKMIRRIPVSAEMEHSIVPKGNNPEFPIVPKGNNQIVPKGNNGYCPNGIIESAEREHSLTEITTEITTEIIKDYIPTHPPLLEKKGSEKNSVSLKEEEIQNRESPESTESPKIKNPSNILGYTKSDLPQAVQVFKEFFPAKMPLNKVQTEIVVRMFEQHGEEKFRAYCKWAAGLGMGRGRAVNSMENGLKNWGRKYKKNGKVDVSDGIVNAIRYLGGEYESGSATEEIGFTY